LPNLYAAESQQREDDQQHQIDDLGLRFDDLEDQQDPLKEIIGWAVQTIRERDLTDCIFNLDYV
jgi:hypothetical protein